MMLALTLTLLLPPPPPHHAHALVAAQVPESNSVPHEIARILTPGEGSGEGDGQLTDPKPYP